MVRKATDWHKAARRSRLTSDLNQTIPRTTPRVELTAGAQLLEAAYEYEPGSYFPYLCLQRSHERTGVMVYGGGFYSSFNTIEEFDAVLQCSAADHALVLRVFNHPPTPVVFGLTPTFLRP